MTAFKTIAHIHSLNGKMDEITVLDNSALNIRNQKLLKNFINIKDKKIGKTIEKLIEYICDDKK